MKFFSMSLVFIAVAAFTLQARESGRLEIISLQDQGLLMSQPVPDQVETDAGPLAIHPIQHATFAMEWNGITIYVDPNGGSDIFEGLDSPDIILITDIHGDHLNQETLGGLDTESSTFVVPRAVADELPDSYREQLVIIGNGERTELAGVQIRAVPMYNLPVSPDAFHTRGRGNGYVLTMGGTNVYISGDTEDIPEMRSLEDIDVAFVCMNLPYTMDVNQAAGAVLDFEPRIVYPYHYRGQDTEQFRELVEAQSDNIEVRLREWYRE